MAEHQGMPEGQQRIPVVSLDKPAFGAPCNGCGLCCISEVCALGLELGDSTHCKALIAHQNGSYACGLVVDPYRYLAEEDLIVWKRIDEIQEGAGEASLRGMYRDMLATGKGCDSGS